MLVNVYHWWRLGLVTAEYAILSLFCAQPNDNVNDLTTLLHCLKFVNNNRKLLRIYINLKKSARKTAQISRRSVELHRFFLYSRILAITPACGEIDSAFWPGR